MANLEIPISKGGKGVVFVIDGDALSDILNANPALMADLIARGLKEVLNSRMGQGILAPTKLAGEALENNKAKALAKAEENFNDFKAGKLLKGKATKASADVPAKVLTEARRLAREVVKNQLRERKIPIGQVAPKDITALATQYVKDDPSYVEQAKESLARLEAETAAVTKPGFDIASFIKLDPKKVAKAAAEKAARPLSAKQAGLPKSTKGKAPPARGQQPQHRQGILN